MGVGVGCKDKCSRVEEGVRCCYIIEHYLLKRGGFLPILLWPKAAWTRENHQRPLWLLEGAGQREWEGREQGKKWENGSAKAAKTKQAACCLYGWCPIAEAEPVGIHVSRVEPISKSYYNLAYWRREVNICQGDDDDIIVFIPCLCKWCIFEMKDF